MINSKKIFKRVRVASKQSEGSILYNNCDIPAALFFKNLCSGDLSVLGNAPRKELEKAFYLILDEYCELDDNNDLREQFKKEEIISLIQADISALELAIYAITFIEMTRDERISIIDKLNEWKPPHAVVKFNKDAYILQEITRIKTRVIGGLKTRLSFELAGRKVKQENIKRTFEDDCVAIEMAISVHIDDNCSLRKFISYNKAARERAAKYNKANG